MGKCAFITGASGGIGYATALRLAADGFEIAACYNTDEQGADNLRSELEALGIRHRIYKADVADYSKIKEIFAENTDTVLKNLNTEINSKNHHIMSALEETLLYSIKQSIYNEQDEIDDLIDE